MKPWLGKEPWPTQVSGLQQIEDAIALGYRRIMLTCSTGGGKTLMFSELARRFAESNKRVAIFTNRKILTGQASRALESAGINHGILAAGYHWAEPFRIQVCSLQTVFSRALGEHPWIEMPSADLVVIDEAHSNKAEMAQKVMRHYKDAIILGVSATPIGVAKLYDHLVVAGRNSELRALGSLVPCDVFAPDEPDMKGVRRIRGEYVRDGMIRRTMQTLVFGNVFSHWRKLNPSAKPTLVFAPGVKESRWLVEQFQERGATAAHIDGETADDERQRIFLAHQSGDVQIISSCGVLREGFDAPWAEVGILIQPCGGLSTYIQIVGRLLRAYPGKERATLIDHAGAWHMHGSPNSDREWELDDTDTKIAKKRKEQLHKGELAEGVRCPICSMIRKQGPKCPFCGHEHVKSSRIVRMLDGTLTKKTGSVVKKRPDRQLWSQCLFACGRSGRTLNQAAGLFRKRTGYALPRDLHPASADDWGRKVAELYPYTLRTRTRA